MSSTTELRQYDRDFLAQGAAQGWTWLASKLAFIQPLSKDHIKEVVQLMAANDYSLKDSMYVLRGILKSNDEAASAIANAIVTM